MIDKHFIKTMGRPPIDPIIEGRIRELLDQQWSERKIISFLKKKNLKVSKGLIYNIKNRDENQLKNNENKRPKNNCLKKLSTKDLKTLDRMTKKINPPTQKAMASVLGVSQQNISHHINKTLNKKKRKKGLVHCLSDKNIADRKSRSFNLYRMLNKSKWQKVITTDEAWFRLVKTNGKRRIQYVKRDEKNPIIDRFQRKESFAKGFMVWAGVSYNGKTSLHFVDPGAKINSEYYCNNVLKKFLARDARRLYPKGDFLFHHDSAPSHRSAYTKEWMKSRMRFISEDKWMAKSPDCAPMDYFVWGYLKRLLWNSKPKDTAGLKRALKRAWKKLPQKMINNALAAWPKRVLKVYKNKGSYIE